MTTENSIALLNAEEKALPLWQLRALRRGLLRSCLNCDYFTEATEVCRLANSRPPVKVLVLGCSQWIEMIPF
jgi:hypothetical protein